MGRLIWDSEGPQPANDHVKDYEEGANRVVPCLCGKEGCLYNLCGQGVCSP